MKNQTLVLCALLIGSARLAICDVNPSGVKPASVTANMAATLNVPSKPIKTAGVPNFGKLNDHIWRSGQPSKEGYQVLASQGLKTVVNLRSEFPQDKDLIPDGVKYIYIPIRDEHAPTAEQAQQFIAAASDPANWPLLVHCEGGQGRAGTMAAIARWSLDKWQDSAIMSEVGNFRVKYLGFVRIPMAGCQKQFIKRWEDSSNQTQVAAQIQPAHPSQDVSIPALSGTSSDAGSGSTR